jgi:hypothetical protein
MVLRCGGWQRLRPLPRSSCEFAMGSGEMSEAEFTAFLQIVFDRLADNTIDGSIHDICMDWRHMLGMLLAGWAAGRIKDAPDARRSGQPAGLGLAAPHRDIDVRRIDLEQPAPYDPSAQWRSRSFRCRRTD